MQPNGSIRLSVDSDLTTVAIEEAIKLIDDHAKEKKATLSNIKYLYSGLGADLLMLIGVSIVNGLSPSLKQDYGPYEWSLHAVNLNDFSHIIVWSPGA